MKKNQVDNYFTEDTKRKNNIISSVCVIVIVFIISLAFLFVYIDKNKVQYVKYKEVSDVLYDVYLKNNNFFDTNTVEKDNQYISELIDKIKANFKYNLTLEQKDVNYKYVYRIEANVVVKDKNTKKALYKYNDTLLEKKEISTSDSNISINESIEIDYNKYNDLIIDFIKTYNLTDANSMLNVNLYVDVIGSCDEIENNKNSESITTLEIPLTNKTMAIDITNNLVNNDDNVMICSKPLAINIIFIIISLSAFLLDVILLINLVFYIKSSRSAKTIYEKELKKILNNYRSYIQKVNTKFDLTGYQPLKVDNFTDMLEIRDTTNQPILMVENDKKNSAYFIIPTSTKILYTYSIKVSDIEKEMQEK